MYSPFRFIFFISTIKILTIYSQEMSTTGQTGPGLSSCFYYADFNRACGLPLVEVKNLPKTCTSFVAYELAVDSNINIYKPDSYGYNYDFLKTLGQNGKNLYIYYSHDSSDVFIDILNGGEAKIMKEINNLIAVKKDIPGMTGLLIVDFWKVIKAFCGLTDKVVKYIELMKEKAQLEIGLIFERGLVDYYENPTYSWLNLTILNCHVNFYVFYLVDMNHECTPNLKNTGLTPMCGKANYTLEKVASCIQKANIPKEKLYFMLGLSPNKLDDPYTLCDTSYIKVCLDPIETKDWCADSLETLYAKGKWAKDNGAGFVGRFVDLDDSQNTCCCGPFPAFNAILAGIQGSPQPPACPKFDRKP